MKLSINFRQQNPDFDKEYAAQYHDGRETPGNVKTLFSTGYEANIDLDELLVLKHSTLEVNALDKNDQTFVIQFENMRILKIIKDSKAKQFGVSEKLLLNTNKFNTPKNNSTRFYFYFKNRHDYVEIFDGIFILKEEIPEVLRQKKSQQ